MNTNEKLSKVLKAANPRECCALEGFILTNDGKSFRELLSLLARKYLA